MNKNVKSFLVVVFSTLVVILVYNYHTNRVDIIKESGSITLGKIVKVDDGGEAFDMSAIYEYKVKNKLYSRKVEIAHSDKHNFKGCLWSIEDCSGGLVWVLYSEKEPKESLVNLDYVFSGTDTSNLIRPTSLEGFY